MKLPKEYSEHIEDYTGGQPPSWSQSPIKMSGDQTRKVESDVAVNRTGKKSREGTKGDRQRPNPKKVLYKQIKKAKFK